MFRTPKTNDAALDVTDPAGRKTRTTTREALLGMLSLRPMTGYELKATMCRTTANFWQESFGQIYPALKSLVSAGLAEVKEERSEGKRFSKTYRLTEAGRVQFAEWLSLPCERQTIRDELLLKMFFGMGAAPQDLLRHVAERRKSYLADLERYRALDEQLPVAQKDNPGLPFFQMTLRKGLIDAEAQLGWCDETIERLESLIAEKECTHNEGKRRKHAG